MKKYFSLAVLFVAVPLVAYEVGPSNRANFGSAAQQQPMKGYRTFTNSNNQWRQGVQTKPVQTSMAGSSVKELDAAPAKQNPIGKQAAPTQSSTGTASSAIKVNPVQCEGGKCNGAIQFSENSDPAAVMQQVQNMAQTMQALTGGVLQGAQQPAAGQTGGMPAGMPDISALMGGMMPAVPATAPKK